MTETPPKPAGYGKRILAGFLDFLTAFFALGWGVGRLTGQSTETGFSLQGGPAIAFFALFLAYFVIGRRTGGTLWQRILRIPPSP